MDGPQQATGALQNARPMIPLHLLMAGEPAIVEDLCGPDAEVHRLREMGLEPGVEVEMVRGGSPLIVRVGHRQMCLRYDAMTDIFVRPKNGCA